MWPDETRRGGDGPNAQLDDIELHLTTQDVTISSELENCLAGIPRYEGSNPSLSASEI